MFLKFIHLKTFIISFILGLSIMVFTNAHKKKIYVYPTPETVDNLLYKDKADNCYIYKQSIVKCPTPKKIFNIPLQF
jgi:hypothetical protein